MAAAFAVGVAMLVQWLLTVQACHRDGVRLGRLWSPLSRVALACVVMALAVWGVRALIAGQVPASAQLLLEVATGVLAYPVALGVFGGGLLGNLLQSAGLGRLPLLGRWLRG